MQNSECTIGSVVRYMGSLEKKSNRLSKVTTTRLIYELASDKIIAINKPERRGQGCQLLINEANAFNLIDN